MTGPSLKQFLRDNDPVLPISDARVAALCARTLATLAAREAEATQAVPLPLFSQPRWATTGAVMMLTLGLLAGMTLPQPISYTSYDTTSSSLLSSPWQSWMNNMQAQGDQP